MDVRIVSGFFLEDRIRSIWARIHTRSDDETVRYYRSTCCNKTMIKVSEITILTLFPAAAERRTLTYFAHGICIGWQLRTRCAHMEQTRYFDLVKAFNYIERVVKSIKNWKRLTSYVRNMFWATILYKFHDLYGYGPQYWWVNEQMSLWLETNYSIYINILSSHSSPLPLSQY